MRTVNLIGLSRTLGAQVGVKVDTSELLMLAEKDIASSILMFGVSPLTDQIGLLVREFYEWLKFAITYNKILIS